MERKYDSKEEFPQRIPTKGQQALRRALQEARGKNEELASQNLALKEQMASRELSWAEEKKRLLEEKDCLASTLLMARNDIESLVKITESARASFKNSEERCKTLERKMMEKELRTRFLLHALNHRTKETRKFENFYRAESNKNNKMNISFDKTIIDFNAEWESRWIVREEEVATKLTSLKEEFERKLSQTIQESKEGLASAREEMMALDEKNLAQLSAKDEEMRKSESEWKAKFEALEGRLRCELAAHEATVNKTQELQEKTERSEREWLAKEHGWLAKEGQWMAKERERLAKEQELQRETQQNEEKWLTEKQALQRNAKQSEEKWLAKQQEWLSKECKNEEERRLLTEKNTELQELALMSDKEKAMMRKVEEKARRETEKRLKKERKEEEERAKKDKVENEKKEKERLKREQKETEKKEKRERKERKKEEERAKKEKEEHEKKEKERLKREKRKNKKENREKMERKKREQKENKMENREDLHPFFPTSHTPISI